MPTFVMVRVLVLITLVRGTSIPPATITCEVQAMSSYECEDTHSLWKLQHYATGGSGEVSGHVVTQLQGQLLL